MSGEGGMSGGGGDESLVNQTWHDENWWFICLRTAELLWKVSLQLGHDKDMVVTHNEGVRFLGNSLLLLVLSLR